MATVCKRSLSRVPAGARARAPHSSTGARRDAPRTMSATAPSSSSSNARNAYTNTLLRFAPASAKESKSHQSGAAAGGAMLPIVKGLSGSFGGIIEVRARRRGKCVMGVWPCPRVQWRSVAQMRRRWRRDMLFSKKKSDARERLFYIVVDDDPCAMNARD